MKRFFSAMAMLLFVVAAYGKEYRYECVAGDPLGTRIYTLDNGLRVYMTVNREQPRIQTFIAVRVGAKNDPAETTGLAHYFEHLMFKGTEQYGTQNYEAEKPLLDEIERLFEVYRKTADPKKRKEIYSEIDRVSGEAARYAIPNEYDKLMAAIGGDGSNAYTGYDETVYIENIPSNQIDNWARIQADRFASNVIRGFHTELETVYEEYNMSLTDDEEKASDALYSLLYPTHPYGQHAVIGTQEHLKNPSITNIKEYYKTYYVPNNMAICMSGDFDPEETIAILDRRFGGLKPNDELPEFRFEPAEPLTVPAVKEVSGYDGEFVFMGWRTGGARSKDVEICELASRILANGYCGLADIDLMQSQKILGCDFFNEQNADLGSVIAVAYPKYGQRLEDVRDLILAEVAKLRIGDFDDELVTSSAANYKLEVMRMLEDNEGRAMAYVSNFINGTEWADDVASVERIGKITKEDIVAWARENMRDDNYAIVYKRRGKDKSQKKIDKPHITPIPANRDAASPFLAEIQATEVAPIEPVFVDYDRDMSLGRTANGQEILYKRNESNDLFTLGYVFEYGKVDNPLAEIAIKYMELLGTDEKSRTEIQREFYSLACRYSVTPGTLRTYVDISGLTENMERAVALFDDYIANLKGDEAVLAELKRDILAERRDDMQSQSANFSRLRAYATYGPEAERAITLTNAEIAALTSDELVACIKSLATMKHRILYYGPDELDELTASLDSSHGRTEITDCPAENGKMLMPREVADNEVLFVQYDSKQVYYSQYSKRPDDICSADARDRALLALHEEYFAGGMNGIVFQEMREARALAYSASAHYNPFPKAAMGCSFVTFIATQNDKIHQAVETFDEIIENMPSSQTAFEIAKQSLLTKLATSRTVNYDVLWKYVSNLDRGLGNDAERALYEQLQDLTLEDVVRFHNERITGRKYLYLILGNKNSLDMKYLRSLGKVTMLSQNEIFGY